MVRAPRLLLLLAIAASLFVAAVGQDDKLMRPFNPSCSTNGNYTDGSQYKKNLDQLLSTLPTAAGNNGWFYNGTVGTGPDQVFGLIMCFADRNATQCQDCLTRAPAGITQVCPSSRTVSAAYDACLLRYSSEPFFSTAELIFPFDVYYSGEPVTSAGVANAWLSLMSQLMATVVVSPLRLANESKAYSSSQDMYGLAQCTRDLNASECSRCLNVCINDLARLFPKFPNNTGGAIKGYSCYLRYQVGAFNVTWPPAPPALPPSSPEPAQGSSPSSKTGLVIGLAVSFGSASFLITPTALPPSSPEPAQGSSPSSKTGIVIGLAVGSVSFLIILGFLIWIALRRRREQALILEQTRERELEEGNYFEKGAGPKRFRYSKLADATCRSKKD